MGTFATTTALDILTPGYSLSAAQLSIADKGLTWAENTCRAYLSKRYDFSSSPFLAYATVPPLLTSITERLAVGYFFQNNSRGGKEQISRGKEFIKDAMDELKALKNFDMDLVDTDGALISERSSRQLVRCNTTDYETTFDEDSPLNWQVDPDKIDDIQSARR